MTNKNLIEHLPELMKNWPKDLLSPCFIIDEVQLKKNAAIIADIQQKSGAKILFALKAFSCFPTFNCFNIASGTETSSLFEAMLAKKYMPNHEQHIFSPAYNKEEFKKLSKLADHFIFNSITEWQKYQKKIIASKQKIHAGLRLNPQKSVINEPLYDPSNTYSGFGIPLAELETNEAKLTGISGFHFHNLCEQNATELKATLLSIEEKFGKYFSSPAIKWLNFGGGHLLTDENYDIESLCYLVKQFKKKYDLEKIYLEPGEAWSLNAGIVVARVVDIREKKYFGANHDIAFLNWSAINHLSDAVQMETYAPPVQNGICIKEKEEPAPKNFPYTYIFKGNTCAAGDRFGKNTVYAFQKPLQVNQPVIFTDMAIYSMVKMTMFNGINKPQIAIYKGGNNIKIHRNFSYRDFEKSL